MVSYDVMLASNSQHIKSFKCAILLHAYHLTTELGRLRPSLITYRPSRRR